MGGVHPVEGELQLRPAEVALHEAPAEDHHHLPAGVDGIGDVLEDRGPAQEVPLVPADPVAPGGPRLQALEDDVMGQVGGFRVGTDEDVVEIVDICVCACADCVCVLCV